MNHATGPFRARKLRKHFRNVISNRTVLNIRTPKNMPDENVEIEAAGHPETPLAFKQGVEESFVVENQIARFFVGEQLYQTLSVANSLPKHRKNEVDVFGRELDPAIGLNHLHSRLFDYGRHQIEPGALTQSCPVQCKAFLVPNKALIAPRNTVWVATLEN